MIISNKESLVSHGNVESRKKLLEIAERAISEMDPDVFLNNYVEVDENTVNVENTSYNLSDIDRIFVIGVGKGSSYLVGALEKILKGRVQEGVVVEKEGQGKKLDEIPVLEASHPLPSESGFNASKRVVEIAKKAKEDDLVFFCILGGASSLLPYPPEEIDISEKAKMTDLLLKSGAPIEEINAVRKHISEVKGGKLARLIAPARMINLIVVDEVSGSPWGPTVPDQTTFKDAIQVLKRYQLWKKAPNSIKNYLESGREKPELETPGSNNFDDINFQNLVLLDANSICEAARLKSENLGYNSMILSTSIEGESKEVGRFLASIASEISGYSRPIEPPCAVITGGETTVSISDECGHGGPNQELALAFSSEISGEKNISFLSMGTDGTDGPTDIAGGLVDGYTFERAESKGLDIEKSLKKHESSYLLRSLDDAIYTSDTKTNLMDLRIILIEKE